MSSFSTGKYALRALAQSLGKEFGPKGVHVGHAVIDGVIDIPRTKEYMKDAGPDAKISPDAVSALHCTWMSHADNMTDCGCVLASSHAATELFYKRDRYQTVGGEVVIHLATPGGGCSERLENGFFTNVHSFPTPLLTDLVIDGNVFKLERIPSAYKVTSTHKKCF